MTLENNHEHSGHRRKASRRQSILPYFLVISGVIACLLLYFRFLKPSSDTAPVQAPKANQAVETAGKPSSSTDNQGQFTLEPINKTAQPEQQEPGESSVETSQNGAQRIASPNLPIPERITLDPASFSDQDYDRALTGITSFYSHLDQQPYLKQLHLPESSAAHFSKLIQKLLDNPPIVSDETKDLYSILKNTSHFFRVIGNDDLQRLKAVINHEKQSYEDILADLYIVSHHPDTLHREFSIQLKTDSLYEYAGYFLTTMGGRLYLFRRDAALRMLISYYSILIVEEANRNGSNHAGIDVRPAVDRLIGDMESSGNQLAYKAHYLDTLYDLKEKYQ